MILKEYDCKNIIPSKNRRVSKCRRLNDIRLFYNIFRNYIFLIVNITNS